MLRAVSFDAQHGWRERAPVLREGSICPVRAAAVARYVLVLCAPGDRSAVLDVVRGQWHTMPAPPRVAGDVVWTGKELLGLSLDGKKLLRYVPGG